MGFFQCVELFHCEDAAFASTAQPAHSKGSRRPDNLLKSCAPCYHMDHPVARFHRSAPLRLRRARLLVVGCLLCTLLPWLPIHAAKLDRALQFHGLAQGNYLIGDAEGALRALEACLRHDADYLPALRLKARIHIDRAEADLAEATLTPALRRYPGDPELRLLRALLIGQRGDTEEALKQLRQIEAETTADSREGRIARRLTGLLEMAAGNWAAAVASFLEAAGETGDRQGLIAEAYRERARQQLESGRPEAALATLDEAIAQLDTPSDREGLRRRDQLLLERAKMLARLGRTEPATLALERLHASQPQDPEIALTLASLYADQDRWAELKALIPLLASAPQLKDLTLYLEGRVAFAENRLGTARARFEAAIEAQPAEGSPLLPSLHFYRARCLRQLDRGKEADHAVLAAIDAGFEATSIEEAFELARDLLRLDRAEAVIPQLERLLLGPAATSATLWAQLGRAHQATGQKALAVSAYNQSLSLDRKQADVLALRGSLLRRMNDLNGALADYAQAAQLDPDNAALAYALGITHLQLGEIADAEQAFARSTAPADTLPGALLLHSLTAYVIGDDPSARDSLARYHQLGGPAPAPSAVYLGHLLGVAAPGVTDDPILRYIQGRTTRKEALDAAGRAETPAEARRRICATAFWLARHEQARGDKEDAESLLRIALETGHPDQPEYQFARWQLGPTLPSQ